GRRPPSAAPFLYEGRVTTFGRVDNPIRSQRVTCQIRRLHEPHLEDVPGNDIPAPSPGVEAQVVIELRPCGKVDIPVYHEGSRPAIGGQPRYEAETRGKLQARDVEPLPLDLFQYYTNDSVALARLLFTFPSPAWTVGLTVPGLEFYRQDVQ